MDDFHEEAVHTRKNAADTRDDKGANTRDEIASIDNLEDISEALSALVTEAEDLYIDIDDAKSAVHQRGRASTNFSPPKNQTTPYAPASPNESASANDSDIYLSIVDNGAIDSDGNNDDEAIDIWLRSSTRGSKHASTHEVNETRSPKSTFEDDANALLNGFDADSRMLMMMPDGDEPDDAYEEVAGATDASSDAAAECQRRPKAATSSRNPRATVYETLQPGSGPSHTGTAYGLRAPTTQSEYQTLGLTARGNRATQYVTPQSIKAHGTTKRNVAGDEANDDMYAVPSAVGVTASDAAGAMDENRSDDDTDGDKDDFEHISSIMVPTQHDHSASGSEARSQMPVQRRSPSQRGRNNQLVTSAMLDELLGASDEDMVEAPPPPPRRTSVASTDAGEADHRDSDAEAPPPPPRPSLGQPATDAQNAQMGFALRSNNYTEDNSDRCEDEAPPPPPRPSLAQPAKEQSSAQTGFPQTSNDYIENNIAACEEEAPPPPPRRSATQPPPAQHPSIPAVEPCITRPPDAPNARKQAEGLALLQTLHDKTRGGKSQGGALTANQFSEETRLQILHMVKEGSLSPAQVAEAAFFADKGAPAAAASGKADDGTKNGPILMAGWLKKHAHKFGQNHTRWFELTNESGGKTMRYYTKPRGEEKGVIMLRDVKSIECTGMRLTLMNIHNNRAYRLDAEDAYTCRSWEKALKEPNGKKPQATAAGPVIPRYIAGESDESDGDGLYEEPSDNDAGPSRSAHTGGKSAESDRLEAQWWYAGALGRVEAEQRVTAWGGQRGTFLVRESSQRSPAGTKGYVLTLCGAMGAPITHSLLLVSTTDGACIYKTKATTAKTGFPSVQSLVAHFQAEPFPDGTLLLSAAPPGATGG
eukprot:m.1373613 g.1373613  ORF g.1373613 m.1373613 type:complete len:874 (-) comp24956_c0_seq2:1778-4399(-)